MFKFILKHIILDTLYFPIWWYTSGLLRVLGWARDSLADVERMAALKIWIRSMFQPMFQDYTRSGRIISFFMRFILLIFKLLMVLIWTVFLAAIVLLYLALLPGIVYLILKSFGINLPAL